MSKVENVVIIGSGPAGWTAGIYASREMLDPLLISGHEVGGQLMLTTDVENYPGFEQSIKGNELMQAMQNQAKRYGTRVLQEYVVEVVLDRSPFVLKTSSGAEIKALSVIIATGATAKWLGIESEQKFKGYGVSSCATCDGMFFKDQKIVVIGGGNTAIEEAMHLAKYASHITMLVRGDGLKGEKVLIKRLEAEKKIDILFDTEVLEFYGDDDGKMKELKGVRIINNKTKKESSLDVAGAFVAIGYTPNTKIFEKYLKTDHGYLVTMPDSTKTEITGVYAAGDVQDSVFRQAITSAATGCMAALEVSKYLSGLGR